MKWSAAEMKVLIIPSRSFGKTECVRRMIKNGKLIVEYGKLCKMTNKKSQSAKVTNRLQGY